MTAFLITVAALSGFNVILSFVLIGIYTTKDESGKAIGQLFSTALHIALGAWSIYLLAHV